MNRILKDLLISILVACIGLLLAAAIYHSLIHNEIDK